MTQYLEITCRDPFVVRDGRPIGSGTRMRSVEWLNPSTVAGALRTGIGKQQGRFVPEVLKQIEVCGGLPCVANALFFPFPSDCVLRTEPPSALAAKPRLEWMGASNLPFPDLAPITFGDEVQDGFKPFRAPAFIAASLMEQWLSEAHLDFPFADRNLVIQTIEMEDRAHVSIAPDRGAAAEALLFSSSGLVAPFDMSLQVRVRGGTIGADVQPLGGERRIAFWKPAQQLAQGWTFPGLLANRLQSATQIRMVLVTPAIFDHGWYASWMRGGTIPGTTIPVSLIGASVGRAKPISGWSLESGCRGPKPTRRMAPAGSVYFFQIPEGAGNQLHSRWLEPVSSDLQDCHDGFGLALWGIWK